jgi:CubicO group peptidase (beta-lactamase class C family)
MAAVDTLHRARGVLDNAIAARAFPCAVAEVGGSEGPVWRYAAGRLRYAADAPKANEDTIFDLASLTKVIATSTIALAQEHNGVLMVDTELRELLPNWTGADRQQVTVRDLLEHCSGLPAHRKYYQELSGRAAFEAAICGEPLAYPPRTHSIYSDPGFILLGFVLEDSVTKSLAMQFGEWKDEAGIEEPISYLPPPAWPARTAPTEQDPWRGHLLVGEVHDENAAALDGIAAHAGLFGTAAACGACARWWLSLLMGKDDARTGITSREAALFARPSSVPGSSRALGWDTMLPTSSCGTRMSPRAIGHTGFTGTSLWLDPEQDLYAVLLTNRVHPSRSHDLIQPVRRAFHDAVIEDLEEQS